MSKKLSILCLTLIGSLYAASDQKFVSKKTIKYYDVIVKKCVNQAKEDALEELHGTVPELYEELSESGCVKFIENHPNMLAKAKVLFNAFGCTEASCPQVQDALDEAKKAKNQALQISGDALQEQRLAAWYNEFKLFSAALMELVKPHTPKEFEQGRLMKDRILLNNGKKFEEKHKIVIGAGTLVVLKGLDERRKAMGDDLFDIFINPPKNQIEKIVQSIEQK